MGAFTHTNFPAWVNGVSHFSHKFFIGRVAHPKVVEELSIVSFQVGVESIKCTLDETTAVQGVNPKFSVSFFF